MMSGMGGVSGVSGVSGVQQYPHMGACRRAMLRWAAWSVHSSLQQVPGWGGIGLELGLGLGC